MSAAVGQCVEDLRTWLAEAERLPGLDRGFAAAAAEPIVIVSLEAGSSDARVREGLLRLVAVGEGGRG